ncbi:oligosaccharide flippase family protein [Halobacteriales archaeon Cl-PHB]
MADAAPNADRPATDDARADAAAPAGDAAQEIDPAEREALESISHGAVASFGGLSAQRALNFLTNVLLTHSLGVAVYGVYALGLQITNIVLRFAPLGSTATLVKYVSATEDSQERGRIAGLAYATTVVVSLLLAGGLFLFAPDINAATLDTARFTDVLRIFAVSIPFIALVRVHVFLFRAVERVNDQVVADYLVRPGVRLLAVLGALLLGYSAAGVVAALALAMAVLATVLLPVALRRTGVRPTLRGASGDARRFYNHAGPNALTAVSMLLRSRIDVLLIGYFLADAAAAEASGIYNVALLLVGIAVIPLIAFNQLMPPVASRLYEDDEMGTLNAVYTTITRLIVTTTVPLVAIQVVYGPELLALFGPEYQRGYLVLLVFMVGRLVGNGVGATGWLLMMTEHQYARMVLDWFLAVANVVLSYLFVVHFGLVGAALGTSSSIAVQNLLQVGLLHRYEGLFPWDWTVFKPLAAGVGAIAVMAAVRPVLSGTTLLAVGGLVGIAAFVGFLKLLGIERRDSYLWGALGQRYRSVAVSSLPFRAGSN